MSEVKTFFRFCPSCGRRFHIRLVSKKLIGDRKETTEVKEPLIPLHYGRYQTNPVFLEQDVPIIVDVQEFQYSYQCIHCGHVWSEMHVKAGKV